ncbi:MAG TPA: hypothetical protein VE619_02570 [Nitrososphaeraceae archaeon]|nr:hypothetical protein [Nitrososphaeraceae archaeon]
MAYFSMIMVAVGLIAAVSVASILSMGLVQQAHALTKFFNCVTYVANKHQSLTKNDVDICFNKEFHGSTAKEQSITSP